MPKPHFSSRRRADTIQVRNLLATKLIAAHRSGAKRRILDL